MLVLDIVRKVQRLFGDSSLQIIITNNDVWDWINEAQLNIVRKTGCLTKTATAAASTYPTALPVDWIVTKRLTYNGYPLKMIEIEDLDAAYANSTVPADSPTTFYIWSKQLRLFPNLGLVDAVSVVHDYIALPTVIVADITPLDVPVSYHEDIVRFCIMRAHERNENWKALEVSNAIYENNAGERKEEATLQDDDFYVIRDDPGEADLYGAMWG